MWQNLLFSRLQGLVLDQDDLKHCLNPPKFKFIFKKSLRPLVCVDVMAGGPLVGPFVGGRPLVGPFDGAFEGPHKGPAAITFVTDQQPS